VTRPLPLLMMYAIAASVTVEVPNNENRATMTARHKMELDEMYKFRAEA
jgi:hypothetical protein